MFRPTKKNLFTWPSTSVSVEEANVETEISNRLQDVTLKMVYSPKRKWFKCRQQRKPAVSSCSFDRLERKKRISKEKIKRFITRLVLSGIELTKELVLISRHFGIRICCRKKTTFSRVFDLMPNCLGCKESALSSADILMLGEERKKAKIWNVDRIWMPQLLLTFSPSLFLTGSFESRYQILSADVLCLQYQHIKERKALGFFVCRPIQSIGSIGIPACS